MLGAVVEPAEKAIPEAREGHSRGQRRAGCSILSAPSCCSQYSNPNSQLLLWVYYESLFRVACCALRLKDV